MSRQEATHAAYAAVMSGRSLLRAAMLIVEGLPPVEHEPHPTKREPQTATVRTK